MDKSQLRSNVVCAVANKISGIGKTGMMKSMYFLQQVYKVPLGYDFDIYNYGPYDEDVLVAVDSAKREKLIDVRPKNYNGFMGYEIVAKGDTISELSVYVDALDEISQNFGKYHAKDWELASTIVYLYMAYHENGWDMEELDENVRRIKPHFALQDIKAERKRLEEIGVLCKAVVI
ncbi:MAG: hypothetical protein FWE19_06640 [Oscillospiraceae bacterium]|nr:hypothetical protein [Oscillospiraceae bacterium]